MIDGNMTIQAISPKDLLVYLCLRRYRNGVTGESQVPVSVLSDKTGASPVTVLSCLDRLRDGGYIDIERRGRENHYRFLRCIEADTYGFLDSCKTFAEKSEEAVRAAYIPDAGQDTGSDRLFGYVVQLEEKVVRMSEHLKYITDELDRVRRGTTLMLGQAYEPLEQFDG